MPSKWPLGKPWSLIDDGHLLKQLHLAIPNRGHESIKITKVKGPATQQDIQVGNSAETLKQGNDNADLAADEGVAHRGPNLVPIGKYLAARKSSYALLTHRIQQIIIATLEAEIKLRTIEEAANAPSGTKTDQRYTLMTTSDSTTAKAARLCALNLDHYQSANTPACGESPSTF